MRDLGGLIQDGCGLIYGVIPEVYADLEGLDQSKILRLDLHLERLLVELLGERVGHALLIGMQASDLKTRDR